ncbi:Cse1-domain-containing protein [Fomitiporia mediterranea MF3/22]|uniref:Cse1-domain-containing protein n=1 Tax=Fomitiporia mediterranea (strain MF3/22) TaxID=694068 RepID=UPI00044091FC|nr:Cse1-domain-containing protein [Fomitiporia mediterranea MF3/22]EJD01973.1 Cse1-domain-containing protein [Fomitiporia mediterranea MF3/22]
MSDLPALLIASLYPSSRKQAEQNLAALSTQAGFLSALLQLVITPTQDRSVRLAASVYLKNIVKRRWEDDEPIIPDAEKQQLRSLLVPAMISLSAATGKNLRTQVAETVSIIAGYDFPERWDGLIKELVNALNPSPEAYAVNLSVLEAAHSIFGRWRSEMRSNELFTTINFVLSQFVDPFLQVLRYTSRMLLDNPLSSKKDAETISQAMVVLLYIYYDLVCQDIPPALEDSHAEFFGPQTGIFIRFLSWDPPELQTDADEPTPSVPSQIKTAIFELAEAYTHRYPELLTSSASVESFVRALWTLLGGGQRSGVAYDGLVSQSLRFLSTAIRSGNYRSIFESKETIDGLVEGVVVPNVTLRTHEVEQFEDDPLEYVRLDLSFASASSAAVSGGLTAEGTTRRQAAADVLRALVGSGFEVITTEVVLKWVQSGLQAYTADPRGEDTWKKKDESVYLLTAVATRGATAQQGVTSTNALVDVVQFFSQNVFQDLQAEGTAVHPILQVDAIRYLYTFRNQLTKEQLISVLPYLLRHLESPNYVCYTYAATTIERILVIKRNSQLLFNQEDIREIAPQILNVLLTRIESGGTPEKIAENDYLMKCVMRIILTARATLLPAYETLLQRLINIIGAIAKNPSNPNFDQYIFESISALVRFIVAASSQSLSAFEQTLFGPFTFILQQDIDQFIPYVFQIISQMLELHQDDVPADYRTLLPFLLQPSSWAQKGSIPGLVRLLKAFLQRDGAQLATTGQFTSVLAVVQQKLIPSKVNDTWGFELLQAIVRCIPTAMLNQYMKSIVTMLLTRLQTGKTDNYAYQLVYFFLYAMAIDADELTPDFVIGAVEQVQPQLWSQILGNVVVPQVHKILPKDRKVAIVGLTKMLTQSNVTLAEPAISQWPAAFSELTKLFTESKHLTSAQSTEAEDPDEVLRSIDFEEQGAGYQAAYSKLAASESSLPEDPVPSVTDPRAYVGEKFAAAAASDTRIHPLVESAKTSGGDAVRSFVQSLHVAGYNI